MELRPKTQQAALKHLRRLIERGAIRLGLLNHRVRVQAIEQICLHLRLPAVAEPEFLAQP